MVIHRWQTYAAAFCMSGLALLTMTGCQGAGAPPAVPTTSAVPPDQETDAATGAPASGPPNSASAAQAYARCLSDAGVPVMIVDGNRVVLTVATGQPGGATASSPSKAQQRCLKQVPDYHEPNFNER